MAKRTKSGLKRRRQNPRLRARNLAYVSRMRTLTKKFLSTAGSTEAQELLVTAQKAIDKAAQAGAIHPNQAARRKSRLAKRLNKTARSPA